MVEDMELKSFPPRDQWVPRLFIRDGFFYVIELPENDDLNAHAECNPGTLRIEDVHGNILWRPQ